MKTTILGGVLFLVPFAIVAMVLGKAYQISMVVAEPIDDVIPIANFAGVALVNIIALVLILVVCYVAGQLAKRGIKGRRTETLEGFLIDTIPGYVVFKGVIGSAAETEGGPEQLRPVLVAFDDHDMIAFEMESDDTKCVLFLPGAPSAWSGSTIIVDKSRVTYLSIPTYQAMKLLRGMGRGTLASGVLAADQSPGP